MISAEHKERLHNLIKLGVTDALNNLKEEEHIEEKPDFTTVLEINDNDAPEEFTSGEVLEQVQKEIEEEEVPVVEVPVETEIEITKDATSEEVEQAVQKDLEQKHKTVETCDNEETDNITKLRHIVIKDFGKSEKVANKYPKQDKMGMYLYYDFAHIKDKGYNREKYAPYNAIIDELNGISTERLENIADEQKERREAYKRVEKAFENGAEITQGQAKEVAKAKVIDETNVAYNNETNAFFDKAEFEVTSLAQTSKDLKVNKGKGCYTDLEQYKDQLLQDNIKLEQALKKAEAAGNDALKANLMVALSNNASKLESLNVDIEKEKKEFARIARMSAIDEALDEQEDKQLDYIQLNGKEFKCKTAIVREEDWKDLTNALDTELIDEETSGKNKGYCNMYNSIMLRRLITHYVIKQFGSTKKINSIYVKDLHLYVNDTLLLYQGNLFSPNSIKRVPRDVLSYFKNGMLAPFFDWGIFYKGIHCGGRPLNLRELYFDDAKYLSNYFAADISDLRECKKKDVVQSPYSFMNPDMYFTLFKNLLKVTIQDESFDRQEWDEIKNDKENQRVKDLKGRMKREKRRLNLLDGYKLDVYAGTNGFQSFGISSFTNYVKNRGNKGFLRFALGSSMRFVFAGAGIITNLATHLIGGIYHSLKSENEYQWNDNIKDKMDGKDNSPITSNDTDREVQYAREMAEQGATDAE